MAKKKTAAELAAEYGFVEAFFKSDPELWKLFQRALKEQWTASKFQGMFMTTNWYRSRQASIRQWQDLTTRDPAEAEAKIGSRIAELEDRFSQLGVSVDAGTIRNLATQSLQWAWSEAQLSNIISGYVRYLPGDTSGGIAAMETRIKELAFNYGVTVTSEQLQDWIQGLVSQKYSEDNITDFMRDAAKSKYAALGAQLDAGRTTRDIAGQHIAEFARLLEIDPGNISLDDPILARALQGTVDPKTGLPVSQTVFEMSQEIKRDKRWLETKNARDSMVDATFGILRDMGLVAV